MASLAYDVTFLPAHRSEPVVVEERAVTGDPDIDMDLLLDEYWERGDEIIHVRWSDGTGTVWTAPGIDR